MDADFVSVNINGLPIGIGTYFFKDILRNNKGKNHTEL